MDKKELFKHCSEHRSGTLAYYDAHTHIVPCKVVEVLEEGNGIFVTSGRLIICCTASRGPYQKGEQLEVSGYHTYPRSHRIKKQYAYYINPNYRWVKG